MWIDLLICAAFGVAVGVLSAVSSSVRRKATPENKAPAEIAKYLSLAGKALTAVAVVVTVLLMPALRETKWGLALGGACLLVPIVVITLIALSARSGKQKEKEGSEKTE